MLGAILVLVVAGQLIDRTPQALDGLASLAARGWDISGNMATLDAAATMGRPGLTMLHQAAALGHTKAVEAMVAAGASVEAKLVSTNADGETYTSTPLHLAAGSAKGEVRTIRALIAAGASLEATSDNGLTSLHFAARQGDSEAIKALVAAGASLEAKENTGLTPLHVASVDGYLHAIEVLLALGASHRSQDQDGDSPLHLAALNGQVFAIRALAAAGASVKAHNYAGETPLHLAADKGHAQAVSTLRALMAAGAISPQLRKTQLSLAYQYAADLTIMITFIVAIGCTALSTRLVAGAIFSHPTQAQRNVVSATLVIASFFLASIVTNVTILTICFVDITVAGSARAIFSHTMQPSATEYIVLAIPIAVVTAAVLRPLDISTMIGDAVLRLFFDDACAEPYVRVIEEEPDACTVTCSVTTVISVAIAAMATARVLSACDLGARALVDRDGPARSATNATGKKQKNRGSVPLTNSEPLPRREKEAKRKAAVAAEQQAKRQAGGGVTTTSKRAARKTQAAHLESEPGPEVTKPKLHAMASSNQIKGTAAAPRVANTDATQGGNDAATTAAGPFRQQSGQADVFSREASEVEAAQLRKALKDSAREAREHAELAAAGVAERAAAEREAAGRAAAALGGCGTRGGGTGGGGAGGDRAGGSRAGSG